VARSQASAELVRLSEGIGGPVWLEGLRQRVAFPTNHPNARGGLPFDAAGIAAALHGVDLVLMIGGPFFEEVWYSGSSPFPQGARVLQVEESSARVAFNYALTAGVVGHLPSTLAALNEALELQPDTEFRHAADERNAEMRRSQASEATGQKRRLERAWNREPPSLPRVVAEIRRALPPNTVVVDESITGSADLGRTIAFESADDYFGGRGGGIGQGLAGAIGVKLGLPDRPVVAISGDGSAMYSIQALWTAAHHELAVVFVILANREYRVLKHNLDIYRHRFNAPSNRGYPHMNLEEPVLDFVELAAGMGVAGTRVTRADEISPAIESALASGRPHVVEIVMEGKG
jgi:benzoylformate decarboxylase